jgi:RNA polymerase sigma-70 factor (ECF subfamily)
MDVPSTADAESEPSVEVIGAEVLFRAHAKFVAAFLRHLGTPEPDLDDLVQEVFVVAHRKGGYQPGPAQPRSWLAAISLRVAQAARRLRARRRQSSAEPDAVCADGRDPAEVLETQRSLSRVQRALAQLSLEHRVAFSLFEFEGESCESIAAMWGVPVGTVYSRLHNARRHFMEAYRRSELQTPIRRVER